MRLILKTSMAALILVLGGTTVETYAQRCGGDLTYFLRNTKGEIIEGEKIELKLVRQSRLEGHPFTFYPQDSITYNGDRFLGPGHLVRYPIEETLTKQVQPSERTEWVKVFRIKTGCGLPFIEAAFEYENQMMVIRFHNIPAETNFFVDSVPFQQGTFEIDFKSEMSLKNQKLNREGIKSKEGKYVLRGSADFGYLVSAENWIKLTAYKRRK